jgi:hypothetical protein
VPRLRALLAVLALPSALLAVVAAPAQAATVHVGQVGGLVVAGATGRVFLGDRAASSVVVASADGSPVGTVAGITGVTELAASEDGSTVYAAASGGHEVVAIDAATLAVTHRYTVPATYGPTHLAVTSGRVWFTYGDQWDGDLGSVDVTTGTVTMTQYPEAYPGLWGQGHLDASTARPGVLAISDASGVSSATEAVLDVSSGSPVLVASHFANYQLNNGVYDLDLVPGADQVLVNGSARHAYAAGDLTPAGSYPAGLTADIAANGLVAQGTESAVRVFRPDESVPFESFPVSGTVDAVAWGADGAHVYAAVETSRGADLAVVEHSALSTPLLQFSVPASHPRGRVLPLGGNIVSPVPFPAGATVHVVRTDLDHPGGQVVGDASIRSEDSGFTLRDTPTAGGTVTYTVSYAGDVDHSPVTATASVAVSRSAAVVSLDQGGRTFAYGAKVRFTAHLGTTHTNREVSLWADPAGADRPATRVASGRVNARGDFSASVALTRDTVVTARFAGDSWFAPAAATSRVSARVRISTSVQGQYKHARIGGTPYYWVHLRRTPRVTTVMPYAAGREQRFEVQVLSNGRWRAGASQYFRLGTAGISIIRLSPPTVPGVKARVRSSYVRGASGDSLNATTRGPWRYLYFTK